MKKISPSIVRALSAVVAAILLPLSPVAAAIVQDVVDQVSRDSYRAYLGYPGDGGNPLYTHAGSQDRQWDPEHGLARTNIFNHFAGLGLTTTLDPFTYSGSTYYNVVATLPGAVRPDDIYILGAHFDSVACPGADDNASGVAGIMEAARVLSLFDFEATIQFIAFDREEQGLIGSAAYAGAAKARGDDILGMISLDMIAYNTGNNTADIFGTTASDPLKLTLSGALQTYGGLTVQINGASGGSDHWPFEQNGYQAALMIEDWSNPYYHSLNDNVDTASYINYTFAADMTKGAVGYVAGAAVLLVPEPSVASPGALVVIVLAAAILRSCAGARRARPAASRQSA